MSELHRERESEKSEDSEGDEQKVYQYIEIHVQPGATIHVNAVKQGSVQFDTGSHSDSNTANA